MATEKPKEKATVSAKKTVVKIERNMRGGKTIHFKDGTKKYVDNNYIEELKIKVGSKL